MVCIIHNHPRPKTPRRGGGGGGDDASSSSSSSSPPASPKSFHAASATSRNGGRAPPPSSPFDIAATRARSSPNVGNRTSKRVASCRNPTATATPAKILALRVEGPREATSVVGVEEVGVRQVGGVARLAVRVSGLKASGGGRDTPHSRDPKVLEERRAPRERGRTGTGVII